MTEAGDEWDFYPCRIGDADASIFVNLWFEARAPLARADTRYGVRVHMLEPGDHGMGSAAEAAAVHPAEDVLAGRCAALGLEYVGRVRARGLWQWTFYGPPAQVEPLRAATQALALGDRTIEVAAAPDPAWELYRQFLLPDAERRQWMSDRRLVSVLEESGDPLVAVRRVDHWAYFPTGAARDAFVGEAARDGFTRAAFAGEGEGDHHFGAQLYRDDGVELEHIHGVVMRLCELAGRHGGEYDGWETSVETGR